MKDDGGYGEIYYSTIGGVPEASYGCVSISNITI